MAGSWMRALRAERKSAHTQKAYTYAVLSLGQYLESQGMPTDVAGITSEHLREYLIHEQEKTSPETARLRRTYLSVFFRWLIEEGEVKVNPVARIKPPNVQDRPPAVLTDDEWSALLAACKGSGFEERRDMAILRVMEASGIRRSECANLTRGDVDLDGRFVRVVGKGDRVRLAAIDDKAVQALDAYLRKRPDRGNDPKAPLWISRKGGGLTEGGIAGVVRRRGAMAGLRIHPHQLRHRFAHDLKSKGVSDEEIMALGGWRSRDIMARYARQTTVSRAMSSYHDKRGDK